MTVKTIDSAPLEQLSVLVVDDDADARDLLDVVLSGRGAKVLTSSNVREAVAALEASAFDVLVSDLSMAEEDGFDLARRVRQELPEPTRSIPAIALSANVRPEDARQAMDAGFDLHLPKPAELELLVSSIAGLAHGRGSRAS